MFRNWNYKKKLKLLGGSAIVLLLICYRFSIAATIAESRKYHASRLISGNPNNEDFSFAVLQSRNEMLNKILSQYILDTLDNNKNLLSVASNYCNRNDILLKEYKPGPIQEVDSIKLFTRSLTVEGDYINCLKFVYELERKYNTGKVCSVLFKSYDDPVSKKTNLACTVQVQNLLGDK